MDTSSSFAYCVLLLLLLAESAVLVRYAPASWRGRWQAARGSRRPALDGLRGILATSVFVHHCVISRAHLISGGWDTPVSTFYAQMGVAPVTLFFFITGFLFWKKLMARPDLSFRAFVRERTLRLGPAYWAACGVFLFFVATGSQLVRQVSPGLLGLQVLGWFSFLGAGHDVNAVTGSTRIFGQVWTLRLEWMFYLSLPLMGWFARTRNRLFGLLVAACAVHFIVARFNAHPFAVQFLWKTFGDFCGFLFASFGVGMVIATIPERDSIRRLAQSRAASAIGLTLLLATVYLLPARYGWMESLALALPFFLICSGNSFFGLLESPAALLLGTVSYSFYLLHSLVLHAGSGLLAGVIRSGADRNIAYWSVCCLIGTVALLASCVWWNYLERPFLKQKGKRKKETRLADAEMQPLPPVQRGLGEAVLLHAPVLPPE